jgi:hypothetical protein
MRARDSLTYWHLQGKTVWHPGRESTFEEKNL